MVGKRGIFKIKEVIMKKGQKMSTQQKEKISKALVGHPSFMVGYKHSEKIKKGISKAHKGKHLSPKTEFKKGHRHSQTTLKKISNKLIGRFLGSKSPTWKGGRVIRSGYIMISIMGKYIREHRLVMEKHLGRFLRPKEVVHHIDGDRANNQLNNLMLFSNSSAHRKVHSKSH